MSLENFESPLDPIDDADLIEKIRQDNEYWDAKRAKDMAKTDKLMAEEPKERPPLPPPAIEWGIQDA